jgi:prepilin-type N-terminal cleavage/methylation domain-containing protein
MRPRHAQQGLTLIEILVATSLAAFLITSATAGFVQMRNLARRVEARQQLHNNARLIYERLDAELSTLMQGAAVFAIGKSGGTVELIYMRGKLDNVDFTPNNDYGASLNSRTDQLWSRVNWDPATHILSLAGSSPQRSFNALNTKWGSTGSLYANGANFYTLPTLQRAVLPIASPSTVADAEVARDTTLNADTLGSGCANDIGDYADLINQSVPLSSWCTGLAIEVVRVDGSLPAVMVSNTADSIYIAEGQYVDGRVGTQLTQRPRLIRMRLDLTDPTTLVNETFSFSFLLPGLSPP